VSPTKSESNLCFDFVLDFILFYFFQGGYNIEAISKSAVAVARVLLGEAPGELGPIVATEEGTETVWAVAMEQSKYWKGLDPKACDPVEGKTFEPTWLIMFLNIPLLACRSWEYKF
jgi:hypothetical protein